MNDGVEEEKDEVVVRRGNLNFEILQAMEF